MKTKILVLVVCFAVLAGKVFSCTGFILRENGKYYLCKNLDYFTGEGFIFINQRNDVKIGACVPPEKPSQWVSKYGSVTFNMYGKDLPMSGMNEKGLVVESLWLNETEYPQPDSRLAVPELGWVQYMLDNCSTVEDLIATTKNIRVANTSFAKVHFFVLDAMGQSAVVEFIGGNAVITSGAQFSPQVIENQTYQQSLEFMANNPLGKMAYHKSIGDQRDRFEMVAQMIADKPDGLQAFDLGFKALGKVSWKTENGEAPTQWSLVYDPIGQIIRFRTKDNPDVRTIRFSSFSFDCANEVLTASIQTGMEELTPGLFHAYNIAEAKVQLRNVYEGVPFTRGRIPDHLLDEVLNATAKKAYIR